jgi:hemoglobin-like flavoprotein
MQPEQITLIETSFAKVVPIADAAAGLLYGRLFELDPSLRPLFKGDMEEQGRKLMRMIGIVVTNLTRLETIIVALRRMGEKHATYGVREQHYGTVAQALLWTLAQGLGEHWNPALEEAWTAAYTTLSGVMIEAARAA